MSKYNLRTVGINAGNQRMRVAASATRGYVGEPVGALGISYSSGVADANVITILADNDPVIGTDDFRGILAEDMKDSSGLATGTVVAGYVNVTMPIPYATKIRGKAETSASVDTQSDLTGLIGDLVAFGYDATDYTIQTGGEDDTYGLQIIDGNFSRGTLDVLVDARAMRSDVT